ncbi:Uncharacterised protein g152 [Pycnogonum litorale]
MYTYRLWRKRKEERGEPISVKPVFNIPPIAMRREILVQNRLEHVRNTLICIYLCGGTLMILGITLTLVGALVAKTTPNPYLIVGPTCIIVGIFVSLLSIEIIVKRRRQKEEDGDDSRKSSVRREWSKTNSQVTPSIEENKQESTSKLNNGESVPENNLMSSYSDNIVEEQATEVV